MIEKHWSLIVERKQIDSWEACEQEAERIENMFKITAHPLILRKHDDNWVYGFHLTGKSKVNEKIDLNKIWTDRSYFTHGHWKTNGFYNQIIINWPKFITNIICWLKNKILMIKKQGGTYDEIQNL